MKKIIILLAVLMNLTACKTQMVKPGIFVADGEPIAVRKYSSPGYTIFVDTTFFETPPPIKKWSEYGVQNREIHIDTAKAIEIIRSVLKAKKNKLEARKERFWKISIKLNVSTGKPVSTIFSIEEPTIISLKEFKQINDLFKKHLRATFSGMYYQDYYYLDKDLRHVVPY